MNRKVALVTGGTGGIGKAIVTELARQDYIVCLQYSSNRDEAERIRAVSPNIHVFQHDFSDTDFAFIDEIADLFGRIDALVNCAGIMADESFIQMTPKGFDELFSINVRAPFLLTAKVFELMKANGYGRIINISSFTVKYGMGRNQSIQYAASKSALESLTTGLARIGAEHNVLVNTIRPGIINTGMQKDRPGLQERINMVPLKRLGEPSEIADLIGYLFSKSGDFITGETFTVAGGE